jgi:hypothetical protein
MPIRLADDPIAASHILLLDGPRRRLAAMVQDLGLGHAGFDQLAAASERVCEHDAWHRAARDHENEPDQ